MLGPRRLDYTLLLWEGAWGVVVSSSNEVVSDSTGGSLNTS